MKTAKFYSALTLILILLTSGAMNVIGKNNTNGNPRPFLDDKKLITYVVTIYHDAGFENEMNGYMVVMTDGKGKNLSEPQTFIPGTWTYIFHETGPSDGIRTAMLIKAPHTGGPGLHFRNASIHGPFECGHKYELFIVPEGLSEGNTGIR